ncbi:MAG: hypothetical protein U9R15_03250 [Chloroflexota bacterium]|nr:hypothetical protein [Chloroflexota bacterium]
MDEYELFPDEEEEAIEEEGANRTFIILVGALGGLLAMGLCMFAVWAFVINPRTAADRLAQNESIEATNAAIAAQSAAGTVSPEASPDTADTPAPTDTPEPTETEAPTEAPEETVEGTVEGTPAEAATGPTATAAAAEATVESTATPKPTATRRPTPTSKSGDDNLPGTGVGALGASALAVGLLFLIVVVRRVRRTV